MKGKYFVAAGLVLAGAALLAVAGLPTSAYVGVCCISMGYAVLFLK